jgi:hypothetical protein
VALRSAGFGAAGGAGVRVCERLSRYGERRGDGHLHALTGSQYRRGVVGILEFRRRRDFVRRGCLRHRFPVARGIDFASGKQCGLRHGLRATDGCHLVESGYLVVRLARFQFSHPDWLDHRRGHCQSADECEVRNQRRGLGPGVGYRQVAAALAHLRIYPGLSASFGMGKKAWD